MSPRSRASSLFPAMVTALAFAFCGGTSAVAQEVEEILDYDVAIDVRAGGEMTVTERIRVRALGDQIRRGIFRDFPTTFPRHFGLSRIEAPFELVSVTRDGSPERHVVEGIGDGFGRGGVRVRIGRGDVFLDRGVYTYEIVYRTGRWVRFGEDADELYWNVTGNGWVFPIRSATAAIRVEGLGTEPTMEMWTGPEGSTQSAATASWDGAAHTARFATTRGLGTYEGLTVRLTFPPGQLPPPTDEQRAEWLRLDWGGYIDGGWVVLFVLAVYLLMWRQVGADPAAGPTTLRREPPEGYSPAALGFIESRGYAPSQLSAALVSMALKGAIRIENDDGSWTIHRAGMAEDLSKEERKLYDKLLGSRKSIEFERSRHSTLRSAITAFRSSLKRRLEREYFVNNRAWFVAGLVVSVLGFVVLAWRWRYEINPVALFLGVWLTGWTAGVATLVHRLFVTVRSARATKNPVEWAGAGFLALFSLPFVGAEIGVGGLLVSMMPTHLIVTAIGIGVTNVAFYHLLERPTLKGRGVLDQLDGFRRYLGDSDDDRALPRTDDQLAVFERYLPFAIALGLEDRWTAAFDGVLRPAMAAPSGSRPLSWYDHGSRPFDSSGFAHSLGTSMSSTLSSMSSPPPSSGGGSSGGGFSSGGGSSGGGGGGGGGGGW